MKVKEKLRGNVLEIRENFIKCIFIYEGIEHITLNSAGVEYLKMVLGDTGEGDFRYILIKWD